MAANPPPPPNQMPPVNKWTGESIMVIPSETRLQKEYLRKFTEKGTNVPWEGGPRSIFAALEPDLDAEGQPLQLAIAEGSGAGPSSSPVAEVIPPPEGRVHIRDAMFEKGHLNGSAKVEFSDGSYYEGNFKSGFMHGHGQLKRPNGIVFTGEWEASQKKQGVLEHRDSGWKYEGKFNSSRNSVETLKRGCGRCANCVRTAKSFEYKGYAEGPCTFTDENGWIFSGTFKEGEATGFCKFTHTTVRNIGALAVFSSGRMTGPSISINPQTNRIKRLILRCSLRPATSDVICHSGNLEASTPAEIEQANIQNQKLTAIWPNWRTFIERAQAILNAEAAESRARSRSPPRSPVAASSSSPVSSSASASASAASPSPSELLLQTLESVVRGDRRGLLDMSIREDEEEEESYESEEQRLIYRELRRVKREQRAMEVGRLLNAKFTTGGGFDPKQVTALLHYWRAHPKEGETRVACQWRALMGTFFCDAVVASSDELNFPMTGQYFSAPESFDLRMVALSKIAGGMYKLSSLSNNSDLTQLLLQQMMGQVTVEKILYVPIVGHSEDFGFFRSLDEARAVCGLLADVSVAGRILVNVPGDSHCLFWSVLDQLVDINHPESETWGVDSLRKAVVSNLRENPLYLDAKLFYDETVEARLDLPPSERDADWETYLLQLEDERWGDNLCCQVIADQFNVEVVCFSTSGGKMNFPPRCFADGDPVPAVGTIYIANLFLRHFVSLRKDPGLSLLSAPSVSS